ncbi:uncharacterized protein MYCFIDRAFT_86556 [Pseudocercospora fijiensis CIRAD86]|uniref:Uncharacterized protein n=1 Tax=Pseudocercospora fijiensis (strain CIRAD86) TaxID=383855 RepID=M3AQI7_PSEFD|nr:uncharacterized protein MYCFIDRAFT_86556 [Pseudocercospora fijiensis CIRAD86]EME86871.1 hypothetical protein MYCFIDRAFT_86556 [Pseudocercospora fijiensis CIRAD86]
MNSKALPTEDGLEPGQRRTSPCSSHWKQITLAVAALCLFLTGHKTFRPGKHQCHHKSDGLRRYAGEKISWKPCGDVAGRPVECSDIDVPMDQFNDTNSGNKTFSIPLIRARGKDATQNLLLNPGGPGGSGVEFLFRRGKQLSEIVGEGFHLLSFDPRGINGSKPLASCYPDRESRRSLSGVRDLEPIHDSPEVYAWTQNFVKACADTMGEHGLYINTPQTAADMNNILDAVGQEDMVYWGFSYGTLLGQTYASLFPERSTRVIIDGVVNAFNWYGDIFDDESFTDTENVLEGFFRECFKAKENCSLSSVAKDSHHLRKLVFDFSEEMKQQPISVYVNNTVYGLLDYPSLWYNGIFPALYKPASWYSLAENLAKLLKGNATGAFLAYGRSAAWDMEGDANQFVSLNDAPTGPAYWPQDRETLLQEILPELNRSIFAATETGNYYARQQWSIPTTHNFTQLPHVNTAHPLLVLSTTYDPICPLISAKAASAAFEGSQIVEVVGYGHCSVAVASTCLAKHVRDFLYHGTLPHSYTKCEVDGPYFIKPEEDGKVVAQRVFETAEEEKIHLAQLELARDWEWLI